MTGDMTNEQLGEDPEVLKEQEEASRRLAELLKRHNVEVDYCEADWRDTKGLIEAAHALVLKHPKWSLCYIGGDVWGIDSNYVFFTSRPVDEGLIELIGRHIVNEGADLPEEAVPPKPKCPKCGEEITMLVCYYPATVTGYVQLEDNRSGLFFRLNDELNDVNELVDDSNVSSCCPNCNAELFMAGEENQDEILAFLKCEPTPEPKHGVWTTCSCGHIAQMHDVKGICGETGCLCFRYDGECKEDR